MFSEEDRQGLHYPHDDALVIRVHIANFLVKIVLVDEGSSTKIFFLTTLRMIKYEESLIQRSTAKFMAFNCTRSTVIRKIIMFITLRKTCIFYTMMVADNESAYNAILEKPWIHQMDAVMLSLHQMLKFLKNDEVEVVKGNQNNCSCVFCRDCERHVWVFKNKIAITGSRFRGG